MLKNNNLILCKVTEENENQNSDLRLKIVNIFNNTGLDFQEIYINKS